MARRYADTTFSWLTREHGDDWEAWRAAAETYVSSLRKASRTTMAALIGFFTRVAVPYDIPRAPAEFFRSSNQPSLDCVTRRLTWEQRRVTYHNQVVRFLDFVIHQYRNDSDLANPYQWAGFNSGRTTDETFAWVTRIHGSQWEAWRDLAASYIEQKDRGKRQALEALNKFFYYYLVINESNFDVGRFFANDRSDVWHIFYDYKRADVYYNSVVAFLDWVRHNHLSEPDDNGFLIPTVPRPLKKAQGQYTTRNETNKATLPYSYIEDLREILCPAGAATFGDWHWAQTAFAMDWFECEPSLIDANDPDCIWTKKTLTRNNEKVTVTKMWSPVRAVALLVKLHLPLRTYQVRMLDSGEADTWRYENGDWVPNPKAMAKGSRDAPYEEGVFRRIRDENAASSIVTGIYVNTNKTADQNVTQDEPGYRIPWQHETMLYWLERLRNWQEKYNPIQRPTPCNTLTQNHTGDIKSQSQLDAMGAKCFLFRDPVPEEPDKPLYRRGLEKPWYRALYALEQVLWDRGETLANGEPIRLTCDDERPWSQRTTTYFPLHSLRVSLITSLIMDGGVPLPVVSKLLAGHSRLVMTLYYTKISPTRMADELEQAHARMSEEGQKEVERFLAEKSAEAVSQAMVSHHTAATDALLRGTNPVGWVRVLAGICLAGRYHGDPEADRDVPGCHNGGPLVAKGGSNDQHRYTPVRHGPENCVACRFLLTSAEFLDGLRACFNTASYKASEASSRAVRHQAEQEGLEKELGAGTRNPRTVREDLKAVKERYGSQLAEADQYTQDMIDAYRLMVRVIEAECSRESEDGETARGQALVSPATAEDLHDAIEVRETNSPLWQIADLCEDAEVYPRVGDDLAKTNAVEKRSRLLDRKLKREGFDPIFMEMDEDMQLKQGNALLRSMAARLEPDTPRQDGLRRVCGMIEANEALTNLLGSSLAEAGPLTASDAPISLEDMRHDNNDD